LIAVSSKRNSFWCLMSVFVVTIGEGMRLSLPLIMTSSGIHYHAETSLKLAFRTDVITRVN